MNRVTILTVIESCRVTWVLTCNGEAQGRYDTEEAAIDAARKLRLALYFAEALRG